MEYLAGDEYVVDTMSRDGVHKCALGLGLGLGSGSGSGLGSGLGFGFGFGFGSVLQHAHLVLPRTHAVQARRAARRCRAERQSAVLLVSAQAHQGSLGRPQPHRAAEPTILRQG